ncbi:hypothetical protein MWU61_19190 [Loktanella sp. F6476L]|uniref:hypothetical protein n=1 Tax=Loktanella sp. F6476L TaxID=2926405 RepID=UPI001FF5B152|nr:hypothetical protein [Loktanella sp. F6476L]MCK0122681.1 hypothetical protein [Loktanella sp. F6476L]
MADGNGQSPSPSDVAARAQANAPSAQGDMERVCLPCTGQAAVEANYTDSWFTPLTNSAVRLEDSTGIVIDGSLTTEPLIAHGQKDGDAPTAPLVTMGTTPPVEVAHGSVVASIIPQGGGEADGGMADLGTALTQFRDKALIDLAPYVLEWETKGLLSIPDARLRGLSKGLVSWYEGEAGFWGGVSDLAVSQYQAATAWYESYVENQTPLEQGLLRYGGLFGQMFVYGTSMAETVAEGVTGLFEDIDDLSEFLDIIMQALRDLASGTVDLMESALDSLRQLPGELGELFAQLIDNGQDWIERLILIASDTNAFEYVFHILMAIAMNMTPNFWAEMSGVVTGFILPEVLIEVVLAVIAALLGGGGIPLLAGRFATFIVKLRGLATKARSLGVLANILEAFVDGIRALARIGKGLHDEIEALARAGADNIARIRHRVRQYKIEVDPNTLGMNGGNIRIVRKLDNPPKRPVRRHDPCKTRGKDPTKAMNSMVDPDIDLGADMDALKRGQYQLIGEDIVVNGRTYGYHPDTGTTFPKAGPGIINIDRAQHQFIKQLNGQPYENAMKFAENFPGLDSEKIAQVLEIWRKCR